MDAKHKALEAMRKKYSRGKRSSTDEEQPLLAVKFGLAPANDNAVPEGDEEDDD